MKLRQILVALALFLWPVSVLVSYPGRDASAVDPSLYASLRYRLIGPFRGSRTVAAVGIPGRPSVFFAGASNGGVWKSEDYGRTWNPIFDDAPTGSIGDIAVSPSRPEIIYVGSGEGLHRPDLSVGEGIFKSTDGGRTWQNTGLKDVQQVGRIIVHPTNPSIVFVAGLGHPFGPNEERGVFRTKDGGKSWEKVLYVNHNTGAIQVEFDPQNPEILFADLWEHRLAPWEDGNFSGPGSGLYKSTNGGSDWRRLTVGLPSAKQGLERICFAIARSNPKRMFAAVDAQKQDGIYRSDDSGESWILVSPIRNRRLGGDLGGDIQVHPEKPDVVFAATGATYRSDDGGRTWTCIIGAPGADDFQRLWINPEHPDVMILTADQGATVTTNGGLTWSSWYTQPTAQLYHVATDSQFPYWVYGGQQESGAIGISSRGNGGQIWFRDWIAVGADEYACVAPDPLNPDIVYGGRVQRYNKATGQSQNVAPEALRTAKFRVLRTMPLIFHPADPKMLLFATNVLWKTTNGGQKWEAISPDLSRERPEIPDCVGDYRSPDLQTTIPRRGVIYALGPSPLDVNVIWAGTDDGCVQVTRDGGVTWKNVSPLELRAWDKVSQIDAGHFDLKTAYVAVNPIRRDDLRPLIYRTHNGGATWTRITNGLNETSPVNVVREDPKMPGLLFAGTERAVSFSFDDGQNWNALRLNMPSSSIRDLVIHDGDLVVGTHGRSIWILDNIGPLRELIQAAAAERAFLFGPPTATRIRGDMFIDTPLLPEEPAGQNPPEGAVLDYVLGRDAAQVTLEVANAGGEVVRRYSSSDRPEPVDPERLPYPMYWLRPPQTLSTKAGHHRFVWDLRYEPLRGAWNGQGEMYTGYTSMGATRENTPLGPRGPFVHTGLYTVRLTVDGFITERAITVRLDPRVKMAAEDLQLQTDLSLACYRGYLEAQGLREEIDKVLKDPGWIRSGAQREDLNALRGSGSPGDPDPTYVGIYEISPQRETVVGLQHKWVLLLNFLQEADARPTAQEASAVQSLQEALRALEQRMKALRRPD